MASQDPEPQPQPFHWHYTELNDHDFQIRGRAVFFAIVLFSVVLLVSLLFLYARWACRYHSHPAPLAPSPASAGGLDQAHIRALPITLYRQPSAVGSTPGGGECCICLGGFEDGEKVKELPKCRHCFHSECVDRWLVAQSSCPICRASLLEDDCLLAVVP